MRTRNITLDTIRAAAGSLYDVVVRTPLVRLPTAAGQPEVFLKLETLQPIGSFKIRASLVVSLDEVARAMALVADRVHVIAEGAAAYAVAAAISEEMAARGHRKVVAVVSGGNIDLARFAQLVGAVNEPTGA